MAQTKVKLISDGVIVQGNLHASHGITTAHIGEGSNLYYTDARSRAAISVSGNALSYNSSTGVITSNFEESPTFTGDITMSKSTSGGLYIKTTSNAEPFIAIQRNSGSNGVAVLRGIDGGHLYIDTGATGAGQATKMVVQADGNVGIGTTSPNSYSNQTVLTINGASYGRLDLESGGTLRSSLFSQAANTTLAVSTGFFTIDVGSERLRIDTSGNVGIGTTSPLSKLHISGISGTTGLPSLLLYGESPSTGQRYGFNVSSDQLDISALGANARIGFFTGGNASSITQRMRIDSGGSIIIGDGATSGTPASDYRSLEIGRQGNTITGAPWKSNLYLSCNATITAGSTAFTYRYANEAPARMDLEDGNIVFYNAAAGTVGNTISFTERMRIDSNGAVGIGRNTASYRLSLISESSGTVQNGIYLSAGTGNSNHAFYVENQSGSAEHFAVRGDGQIRMNASGTGNVLIGTTVDSTYDKLQVIGNAWLGANATQGIRISNNGSYGSIVGITQSLASYNAFELRASGTNGQLFLATNGNVGIGETSPDFRLHVKNTQTSDTSVLQLRLEGNSGNYYDLGRNYQTGFFEIQGNQTGYNNILLAPDSGNVGIGVTSPDHKLHIFKSGQPQISHGLYANMAIETDGNYYQRIRFDEGSQPYWGIGKEGSTRDFIISGYIGGAWTDSALRIKQSNGNVGIGTTSPSYKLSVNGSFYSNSVTTNTYSDANSPPAAYVGIGPAAHNSGGKFRLGQVTSSSSTNATNVTVVTTYSSGHWGAQPTFFLEFAVTYYRPSYIKYYCQHEVSGTRMNIIDGPYGGQISSTPLSVTVTQLCASCHSGQPVYKAVWKWSNNGTYLRTAPFITMFGNPNSRVYTDGDSTESAIDTLYGGSSTPGHGYLLHSINNTQAAGHPRLYTQT